MSSFVCGICGYQRSFPDVIRLYESSGEVYVIAWPSWCWSCGDLSLAEYVPSPAEIVEECKAWRHRDTKYEYRTVYGPVGWHDDEREQSMLAYYDSVLAWRRKRHSAGKCLICGSVMVSLAKSQWGKFEHPGCGGMFSCTFSIFGGIRRMLKVLYSVEGEKLSEEQVVA